MSETIGSATLAHAANVEPGARMRVGRRWAIITEVQGVTLTVRFVSRWRVLWWTLSDPFARMWDRSRVNPKG